MRIVYAQINPGEHLFICEDKQMYMSRRGEIDSCIEELKQKNANVSIKEITKAEMEDNPNLFSDQFPN